MSETSRGTTRVRAVLLAVVACVGLVVLPAAAAEETPEANGPSVPVAPPAGAGDAPSDDEAHGEYPHQLPDRGYPYGLVRKPEWATSVADLKQAAEPSCPAPALPDPTRAGDGSGRGYTVPLLIKLSNGVMLAGYSDTAYHWGDPVPFAIQMHDLTGWIIARVSLPSMRLEVDPADVQLCPDSSASVRMPVGWGAINGPAWSSAIRTDAGGTQFLPYPGSFVVSNPQLDGIQIRDFVAQRVRAAVAGVNADGTLALSTELTARQTVGQPADRPFSLTCPQTRLGGTFSTEPKRAAHPQPPQGLTMTNAVAQVTRAYVPPMPDEQHQVYLPTRPLSGAVEGGSATIGSNGFDLQIPFLPGGNSRCRDEVPNFLYGHDPDGAVNLRTIARDPDNSSWALNVTWNVAEGLPVPRGLADLSLDVTVARVGLPKFDDLPSGYGFEAGP